MEQVPIVLGILQWFGAQAADDFRRQAAADQFGLGAHQKNAFEAEAEFAGHATDFRLIGGGKHEHLFQVAVKTAFPPRKWGNPNLIDPAAPMRENILCRPPGRRQRGGWTRQERRHRHPAGDGGDIAW